MRRRILFLSQCLPYPPHSGVTNRTYHILKELQRVFDVTLVAFSRHQHQPTAADRQRSTTVLRRELTKVMEPVLIESERSFSRKLRVHASSVISRKPYIFFDYGNTAFGNEIEQAVHDNPPDLVHMDSMDLYRWLPALPAVPIACTHHNVESDLLRGRGRHLRPRLAGAYVSHQGDLVENIERELCGRFDLNIMTSDTDAERLRVLAPSARTSVVPNGVDVDFFAPREESSAIPGRLVFLGPTYMFPNRDAVNVFLSESWPAVREAIPTATLHIIGKNATGDKERLEANFGVTALGYVPDVRPHFAEAECSIVPLRVGGGTRLKILDAWAMGKAIVSTSIGCEGLRTTDGENILIRDDPRHFAEAVVSVLRDANLRRRLGDNGRKTAENIYAWSVVGGKIVSDYEGLLESAPRPLTSSVA
ncbi:MAG TPA: glycosyltransferase [Gemmatimonadaceae bacterium]|nr:glycosyltransferase [Gemmatimonadaceae bacterium]